MKNNLRILAAATAMTAAALPAQAGYTIYKDDALPSVLFVEFDDDGAPSDAVIQAPAPQPISAAPMTLDAPMVDIEAEPTGGETTDANVEATIENAADQITEDELFDGVELR